MKGRAGTFEVVPLTIQCFNGRAGGWLQGRRGGKADENRVEEVAGVLITECCQIVSAPASQDYTLIKLVKGDTRAAQGNYFFSSHDADSENCPSAFTVTASISLFCRFLE